LKVGKAISDYVLLTRYIIYLGSDGVVDGEVDSGYNDGVVSRFSTEGCKHINSICVV
jgi:hypothetical protein